MIVDISSASRTRWSGPRVATVAGLVAGVAGIAVMKAAGADMPPVHRRQRKPGHTDR
jgi:hypothetical protein